MKFLIVDGAGSILRTVQCEPDHAEGNAGDGETLYVVPEDVGFISDACMSLVDGVLTRTGDGYSDGEGLTLEEFDG